MFSRLLRHVFLLFFVNDGTSASGLRGGLGALCHDRVLLLCHDLIQGSEDVNAELHQGIRAPHQLQLGLHGRPEEPVASIQVGAARALWNSPDSPIFCRTSETPSRRGKELGR